MRVVKVRKHNVLSMCFGLLNFFVLLFVCFLRVLSRQWWMPTWMQWWSSARLLPPRSPSTSVPSPPPRGSTTSSPWCSNTGSPRPQRRRTRSTVRWAARSSSAPGWMLSCSAGRCSKCRIRSTGKAARHRLTRHKTNQCLELWLTGWGEGGQQKSAHRYQNGGRKLSSSASVLGIQWKDPHTYQHPSFLVWKREQQHGVRVAFKARRKKAVRDKSEGEKQPCFRCKLSVKRLNLHLLMISRWFLHLMLLCFVELWDTL